MGLVGPLEWFEAIFPWKYTGLSQIAKIAFQRQWAAIVCWLHQTPFLIRSEFTTNKLVLLSWELVSIIRRAPNLKLALNERTKNSWQQSLRACWIFPEWDWQRLRVIAGKNQPRRKSWSVWAACSWLTQAILPSGRDVKHCQPSRVYNALKDWWPWTV